MHTQGALLQRHVIFDKTQPDWSTLHFIQAINKNNRQSPCRTARTIFLAPPTKNTQIWSQSGYFLASLPCTSHLLPTIYKQTPIRAHLNTGRLYTLVLYTHSTKLQHFWSGDRVSLQPCSKTRMCPQTSVRGETVWARTETETETET